MDYLDSLYEFEIAHNGLRSKARWLWAKEGAKPLPFAHAFGTSRQSWFGELGNPPPFGEVWTQHKTRRPYATDNLPGDHFCGPEAYWLNGWPAGTPPLETGPGNQVVCCGGPDMVVNSVGLDMPPQFDVAPPVITDAGTFDVTWLPVDPRRFLGADELGGDPDFRLIQPLDLGEGTTDETTVLWGDRTWRPPPTGVRWIVRARVLTEEDPAIVPALQQTGIGCSIFNTMDVVQLTDPLDAPKFQPGMQCTFSSGFAHPVLVTDVDRLTGQIKVDAAALSSGDVTLTLDMLCLRWIEQLINPDTGAMSDNPDGIHGDSTNNPGLKLGELPGNANERYYWMSPRGEAGGLQLWDFNAIPPFTKVFGAGSIVVSSTDNYRYTVSIVSLDPSIISPGTIAPDVLLPAAQVQPGTWDPGMTYPPEQLASGTIAAGVDIDYSQVTGAPSPISSGGVAASFLLTDTYQVVFLATATFGVNGWWNVKNTGSSHDIDAKMTATSWESGVVSQTVTHWIGPGSSGFNPAQEMVFGPGGAFGRGPFTIVQLELKCSDAGQTTNAYVQASWVGP